MSNIVEWFKSLDQDPKLKKTEGEITRERFLNIAKHLGLENPENYANNALRNLNMYDAMIRKKDKNYKINLLKTHPSFDSDSLKYKDVAKILGTELRYTKKLIADLQIPVILKPKLDNENDVIGYVQLKTWRKSL